MIVPEDEGVRERVARFSASLAPYSRKTLANVLATLAKLLRTAVDWDVLPSMPCKIKIPKAQRTPPTFYEIETMRRFIATAEAVDARTHALVLVLMHTGLRRSEIRGLDWEDVNLKRRQLVVRRAVISKFEDTPKSGHGRVIDLSAELTASLAKHLAATEWKTGRVFRQDSGKPALERHLYAWVQPAQDKAGIPRVKGVALHVMRSSACSALAALGAPTIAIQAVAGHQSPQTTQKYMHLAPGLQAAAIRLLDDVHGTDVARGCTNAEALEVPRQNRVEQRGIEPRTSALRTRRSPS